LIIRLLSHKNSLYEEGVNVVIVVDEAVPFLPIFLNQNVHPSVFIDVHRHKHYCVDSSQLLNDWKI